MHNSRRELAGKVQTVLGPISVDTMGVTLAHEHCLIDTTSFFHEPDEETGRKIAHEPVSLRNVGYIRYHFHENLDNLRLLDEGQAIDELRLYKQAGGKTIADATTVDLGRNPSALQRISQSTGLNIIMGSGYFVKAVQNLKIMDKRTEEDIAEEIVEDVLKGTAGTDIHSGMIGEIGCTYPLEDCEKKVLRAAGMAQKEIGAPLQIHPGRSEDAPGEIVKILKDVGTDLHHTAICHVERTFFEAKHRYTLAEAGCYLSYDLWGREGYYSSDFGAVDIPNDAQRMAQIKDLLSHGFGSQVLISYDIAYKCQYMAYGGHGYAHLLTNTVPAMRARGIGEELINDVLVENPKRFFAFR